MGKITLRKLAHVAVLIAIEIIFSRFLSISTPVVRIGFGFVPIALCAMMYGPAYAAVAYAIGDVLGATLFPIGGYFPGFTVSAALTGMVFGLFLHRRKGGLGRLTAAVLINCIGISLLLSTFWLTIITGSPFLALFSTRVIQTLIMIPVQWFVLRLLQKVAGNYIRKQSGEGG